MRAVIYVRDNRLENEEDSIESQLLECQMYAEQQGLDIVDIYRDLGDGCIDCGRRDELRCMLDDADTHSFDVVLVAETACISLCFFELYFVFKRLQKNRIEVICTRQFVKGLIYPPQECYRDYFERERPF